MNFSYTTLGTVYIKILPHLAGLGTHSFRILAIPEPRSAVVTVFTARSLSSGTEVACQRHLTISKNLRACNG